MKKLLLNLLNNDTLQSRMELYIAANNPKDVSDVERIMQEFNRCVQRGGMYS